MSTTETRRIRLTLRGNKDHTRNTWNGHRNGTVLHAPQHISHAQADMLVASNDAQEVNPDEPEAAVQEPDSERAVGSRARGRR